MKGKSQGMTKREKRVFVGGRREGIMTQRLKDSSIGRRKSSPIFRR